MTEVRDGLLKGWAFRTKSQDVMEGSGGLLADR